MRKQTKLVAVLSATALLAIGASAAAFAAGWDNSTGEWQWLDNDGIAVSNEWKKSGNDWFYLGDDGYMVTDSIVEDTTGTSTKYYYVNESGAMVANTWQAVENVDSDLACEYFWYYFGADGKAYTSTGELTTSKLKTINGKKYAFDSEGKMLYGWVDNAIDSAINEQDDAWEAGDYYFGDWNDGAMRTGWQQMTVDKDGDTKTYWFWFDSNGKKTRGADTNYNQKKIDGKWYQFDAVDGHMIDDWSTTTDSIVGATPGEMLFLNGDGAKRTKTWVWAVPAEGYIDGDEDYNNDEARWWYMGADGSLYQNNIKKINGKRYAFDQYGRMKTGLVEATPAGDNVNYTGIKNADKSVGGIAYAATNLAGANTYYFGGTDDGSMKTGYQNVDFDDDTYQMYFDTTTGAGTTGFITKIKKFTANGIVLKANADISNYAGIEIDPATLTQGVVTVDTDIADTNLIYGTTINNDLGSVVLVNTSGALMKTKTNLKDVNDLYYCTNKNGLVTYVGVNKVKKVEDTKLTATDRVVGIAPETGYSWIIVD